MHSVKAADFALASRRFVALTLSVLALAGASRVEAQPSNKKIGFSVQVMTQGLTKTTVAKISVTQVSPDSQALEAGVALGDEVVKIDNTHVPGNSVFTLKAQMAFVAGVPKRVTFRRATGAQYDVVFVRAAKAKAAR
jgi:C-terminal processing protease CtpA/Prc